MESTTWTHSTTYHPIFVSTVITKQVVALKVGINHLIITNRACFFFLFSYVELSGALFIIKVGKIRRIDVRRMNAR